MIRDILWVEGSYTPVEEVGIPNKQGLYIVTCEEGLYDPEYVAVHGHKGTDSLVVTCAHLGTTPIEDYHYGLTDLKWFRVC